ncbi:lytic transglycosylase domain-containing protein [Vibrio parahaemolyticus]|uniref:lytic transglycosylase domain-containing protein n=1 Tax=Vibrio parahaemolyticus TaxID=670 RepID=UPI001120C8C4|nr:lytic transglycosylase domain-containing protein [Vibrio parahaemolyticus]TOG95112.1 hypothetical protein CGI92_14245 [Vibrio parahaemolyticus]
MVRYCAALMLLMCSCSVWAQTIPSLYQRVAEDYHMPASVLYSLALGESKVRLKSGIVRPWPWTLNVQGKPYFYASFDEACKALQGFLKRTEMVDIGLTQHNWRWQKRYFRTPCEAFNPRLNLAHAARVLSEGKRKRGNWVAAAGYFHRPAGGAPARRYEAAFIRHLNQLGNVS